MLRQDGEEVVDMFFADVFYAQVIDDQCKPDGAPFMAEKAGRVLNVPTVAARLG